jgi:hypothetical protein
MNTIQENQTVDLRIDSLKANRNFFSILFTIVSATLAIIADHLASLLVELGLAVILLSVTLVFLLFGLFALTDSLHFYSKYIEYRYMWRKEVHGQAYKNEDNEAKAIETLKKALEADDIGYHYVKYGAVTLLWSFASFILAQKLFEYYYGLILFFLVGILLTFMMIKTYKGTHHRKSWREAFKKFFKRTPLFPS